VAASATTIQPFLIADVGRHSRYEVLSCSAAVRAAEAADQRSGQPSVLEEVAADALHRRGLAGHPHLGARNKVHAADGGDKRVAGKRAGR
jgi:hypothetical protein